MINELPDPVLTQVYRLKAVPGLSLDLGDGLAGHRLVVPLVAGTFTGPELTGSLLPGGSATWQLVSPYWTTSEVRYTLQTDDGALLYVRSRGWVRGDDVEAGEHLVHATTRIETAAPSLEWLNRSVFVTVVGRTALNLMYETYLVG